MALKTIISRLCLFSLLCSTTIAAPVPEPISENDVGFNQTVLVKRIGEDENNPIQATFNIAGWPNIAEVDCYAMLCLLGTNRIYRRNPTANGRGTNYQLSGAGTVPFQAQNLAKRHTSQINSNTVSAEEFPWASTQQGGENAYVFPVTRTEQSSQGGSIRNGYRASNVPLNHWFEITFTGAPFGIYCAALFSNPPNTSVCTSNPAETLFGTTDITLADYAYKAVRALYIIFKHAAGSKRAKSDPSIPKYSPKRPIRRLISF